MNHKGRIRFLRIELLLFIFGTERNNAFFKGKALSIIKVGSLRVSDWVRSLYICLLFILGKKGHDVLGSLRGGRVLLHGRGGHFLLLSRSLVVLGVVLTWIFLLYFLIRRPFLLILGASLSYHRFSLL